MRGLTAKTVESIKPSGGRQQIKDGSCPNLFLIVQTSGVKSWAWRGRMGEESAKITIGRFPAWSLADARAKAAEITRARDCGIDPRAEAKRKSTVDLVEAQRRAMTVDVAFGLYMESEGESRKTAKHKQQDYDREIKPAIGFKPITDITHDDLADIISAKFRAAKTASNRLCALIKRFFKWCCTKGRSITKLTADPAQYLVKLADESKRDRYLSDFELGLFKQALATIDVRFARPFELLLRLGVRRAEAIEARWDEFNLDTGDWTIPSSRSKNGKPHIVPLPAAALAVVNSTPRSNTSDLLFPSLRDPEKPISGITKAVERLNEKTVELAAKEGRTIERWTLHDIRRSVATGLSGRRGEDDQPLCQPHVIEALLNHVSGAKAGVAGIYNRHAYYAEKKAALKLWESHLESLQF